MPAGPEDVNLAYALTCNLSCPSCRTQKIAADEATGSATTRRRSGRSVRQQKFPPPDGEAHAGRVSRSALPHHDQRDAVHAARMGTLSRASQPRLLAADQHRRCLRRHARAASPRRALGSDAAESSVRHGPARAGADRAAIAELHRSGREFPRDGGGRHPCRIAERDLRSPRVQLGNLVEFLPESSAVAA